jgi:hypothetical protein
MSQKTLILSGFSRELLWIWLELGEYFFARGSIGRLLSGYFRRWRLDHVVKMRKSECGATFHYWDKESSTRYGTTQERPGPQAVKKAAGRSERFWLCDKCSNLMTLAVDAAKKVNPDAASRRTGLGEACNRFLTNNSS